MDRKARPQLKELSKNPKHQKVSKCGKWGVSDIAQTGRMFWSTMRDQNQPNIPGINKIDQKGHKTMRTMEGNQIFSQPSHTTHSDTVRRGPRCGERQRIRGNMEERRERVGIEGVSPDSSHSQYPQVPSTSKA